jgi:hypothetical protein
MNTERLRAHEDIDAVTAEYAVHLLSDIGVLASRNPRAGFDDDHAAAEAPIGLRQFDAGVAFTQQDQMRRRIIELECFNMR